MLSRRPRPIKPQPSLIKPEIKSLFKEEKPEELLVSLEQQPIQQDLILPGNELNIDLQDNQKLHNTIDHISNTVEILPPPHPRCFVPGLVPDPLRCQLFYQCEIENGEWKVYNWRCSRGLVFDPDKIECVKGFC